MSPSAREQKDNLSVGLYLATRPHGVQLDEILQVALGYDPQNPAFPLEHYDARFRRAQRVGREQVKNRIPGYFSFNAMPFGTIFVYKATWYVWVNPQTGNAQTVPMLAGDLVPMRRLRERDLATRRVTTRQARTAADIEEQRQAVQRGDYRTLQNIHARMPENESLGEILSGFHGLPYADIEEILPQLPTRTFGAMTLSFQRTAQHINDLQRRLKQELASVSKQLESWVMLHTGLPSNAPQLALHDAARRLTSFP